MWDPYAPPRKPFYRRAWFVALMALLLCVALTAGAVWLKLQAEYGAKAAKFDYSKLQEMESASTIYDRNNNVLGRIFLENRDTIPLSEVPYEMIQAVVAAEDARFFKHEGVDYFGVVRAMVRNYQAKRKRQGGSTLTQQLARNTFPKELPASDRTYGRKILEMFVAIEIEKRLRSKQKILELYLNRVYFGAGFYGVEAAARGYFGKSARALNVSECATLAGLLKNPNNLSPWTNRQACIENRNLVLGRMLELKMIAPDAYQQALASNLAVKNRRSIRPVSYAIDMVRQQVMAQVGRDSAISDGYRIFTTIDGDLQKKAEESLRKRLLEIEGRSDYEHQRFAEYDATFKANRKNDDDDQAAPDYLQGALVALDNDTGAILALVGGRDFNHSQYNRALSAARPAGTAFKPFVFAAAFEKGLFPGTIVQDALMDNRQVMIGGTVGILGEWGPERVDNRYEGGIPARDALVKSKNAATVRLGMQTGIENVIALAKKAGLARVTEKNGREEIINLRPYPATLLGSGEMTLMDLTLAYTAFPNGGSRASEPFIITKIEDKQGEVVFRSSPAKTRVMRDTTAFEIHSCLAEALETGTGDRAFADYGLRKFPAAGKTGTAYNFTDTWFVGYSSEITCGVWAGFDKPRPIYRGAFSNEVVLPVWVEVMNSTFANYKPRDFIPPRGLQKVEICRKSGLLATDRCVEPVNKDEPEGEKKRTTYQELAAIDQVPRTSCTVHSETPMLAPSQQTLPVAPGVTKPSQAPRATLAVDVSSVRPVMMKSPTVIGDDPYNAVKPMTVLVATKADDSAAQGGAAGSPPPIPAPVPVIDGNTPSPPPGETKEVRRAEPVRALDQPATVDTTIKIEPPAPLEF